jgi:transposase
VEGNEPIQRRMGAPQKAEWREERRTRAWERKHAGWSHKEMAKALGVTEGTVRHWIKSARAEGEEALNSHPAPGARPRLTAEQHAHIPAVLATGASASGCAGEVWNSRRLAVARKRAFGVASHPDHCGDLVRTMGSSIQKPIERATNAMKKPWRSGKRATGPGEKKLGS